MKGLTSVVLAAVLAEEVSAFIGFGRSCRPAPSKALMGYLDDMNGPPVKSTIKPRTVKPKAAPSGPVSGGSYLDSIDVSETVELAEALAEETCASAGFGRSSAPSEAMGYLAGMNGDVAKKGESAKPSAAPSVPVSAGSYLDSMSGTAPVIEEKTVHPVEEKTVKPTPRKRRLNQLLGRKGESAKPSAAPSVPVSAGSYLDSMSGTAPEIEEKAVHPVEEKTVKPIPGKRRLKKLLGLNGGSRLDRLEVSGTVPKIEEKVVYSVEQKTVKPTAAPDAPANGGSNLNGLEKPGTAPPIKEKAVYSVKRKTVEPTPTFNVDMDEVIFEKFIMKRELSMGEALSLIERILLCASEEVVRRDFMINGRSQVETVVKEHASITTDAEGKFTLDEKKYQIGYTPGSFGILKALWKDYPSIKIEQDQFGTRSVKYWFEQVGLEHRYNENAKVVIKEMFAKELFKIKYGMEKSGNSS